MEKKAIALSLLALEAMNCAPNLGQIAQQQFESEILQYNSAQIKKALDDLTQEGEFLNPAIDTDNDGIKDSLENPDQVGMYNQPDLTQAALILENQVKTGKIPQAKATQIYASLRLLNDCQLNNNTDVDGDFLLDATVDPNPKAKTPFDADKLEASLKKKIAAGKMDPVKAISLFQGIQLKKQADDCNHARTAEDLKAILLNKVFNKKDIDEKEAIRIFENLIRNMEKSQENLKAELDILAQESMPYFEKAKIISLEPDEKVDLVKLEQMIDDLEESNRKNDPKGKFKWALDSITATKIASFIVRNRDTLSKHTYNSFYVLLYRASSAIAIQFQEQVEEGIEEYEAQQN